MRPRVILLLLAALSSIEASALETLEQSCLIRFATKGGVSSCSGTLVDERYVLTAAHCFSAPIRGAITVGCGPRAQFKSGEGFEFKETFSAEKVRIGGNPRVIGGDFAFVRLDSSARIVRPMPLSTATELRSDFFVPSRNGSLELASGTECRSAGFGVFAGTRGGYYRVTDQSPRNGLRAYVANDSSQATSLLLEGWGDRVGMLRPGDSGSPLYCRRSTSSPWKIVGVLSSAMFSGKGQTPTTNWVFAGGEPLRQTWASRFEAVDESDPLRVPAAIDAGEQTAAEAIEQAASAGSAAAFAD